MRNTQWFFEVDRWVESSASLRIEFFRNLFSS